MMYQHFRQLSPIDHPTAAWATAKMGALRSRRFRYEVRAHQAAVFEAVNRCERRWRE
jgi:hypothetical protein